MEECLSCRRQVLRKELLPGTQPKAVQEEAAAAEDPNAEDAEEVSDSSVSDLRGFAPLVNSFRG